MDEPELQGGDIFSRDMQAALQEHPSELRELYEDSVVLITGATGFLGKILVEKLYRSCPYIKKIFLLIRDKKGKNPETRFNEMFQTPIFGKMMQNRTNPPSNIYPLSGDCGSLGLGLSPEDRQLVLEEVTVVFHGAATVRFDEKLQLAVNINVRGVREMLLLCKAMKNLKALLHLSTAYSHCPRFFIEEKFYPAPLQPEKLMALVADMEADTVGRLTPALIHPWPNTYTYTKAVSEDLLRTMGAGLPIAMIRPSIVVATAKEPLAGWIDNLYGATGVVVAAATGFLRTLHCEPNAIADLVPADLVVNAAIVAAWDMSKERSLNKNLEMAPTEVSYEPKIYNYVSCTQSPITWGQYMALTFLCGLSVPPKLTLWYPFFSLTRYKLVNQLKGHVLHTLPAVTVDAVRRMSGRKPILLDVYRKIDKFADVITYFSTKQWEFTNNNTQDLTRKLSTADREEFSCDMSRIVWKDYFYFYVRGMRMYLVHDGLETVPEALTRFKKLKIAHYSVVTLLVLLVLFVPYYVMSQLVL